MRGPQAPAGRWLPGRIHSCVIQEQGLSAPLGSGSKKIQRLQSPQGLQAGQGQTNLNLFPVWVPHLIPSQGGSCWPCLCTALGPPVSQPPPPGDANGTLCREGCKHGWGPAVPSSWPLTAGLPCGCHHSLRGLSAAPQGLLALSLFFLRRLSIQLELERVAKLASARELSRMFLPDIMSSPKPSWWEKA